LPASVVRAAALASRMANGIINPAATTWRGVAVQGVVVDSCADRVRVAREASDPK